MRIIAEAIRLFCMDHTPEETADMIVRMLGLDMPKKDDHGHWHKEAGAPCPHGKRKSQTKPRSALRKGQKRGIIRSEPKRLRAGSEKKEKDIRHQTDKQIRKGIKSLEKHIRKHEYKMAHPEVFYDGWEKYPKDGQKTRLKHWEHEIEVARKNIRNRQAELKRRENGHDGA